MIERQYGKIIFICDECEYTEYNTLEEDFDDAIAEIRREGWTVTIQDGTGGSTGKKPKFLHICPTCNP